MSSISVGGSGQRGSVNEAESASDATLYQDAKAPDQEEEWVQLLKVEERAREDEAHAELDNENGCKGEMPMMPKLLVRGTERLNPSTGYTSLTALVATLSCSFGIFQVGAHLDI